MELGHYISTSFAGLECIGVIPAKYVDGDIEVYELHEEDRRRHCGAWYPDGALMIWPIDWLDSADERGEYFEAPSRPRNKVMRYGNDGKLHVLRPALRNKRKKLSPRVVRTGRVFRKRMRRK